jgi:pimeloyl-ACP methyl ester carboxylesterase
LAHGFMRKLKHMRGWGEYWQQQGIGVTLVTFCNASWLNGHHQRNADDLVAVRKHLLLDSVIYAGFSAGGLAAYLAAAQDPATQAYLGLDSVDSGDLAIERREPLPIPALFLTAQPSMCNAQSNFQAVFNKWPQYQVRTIAQASHCHFEMPYDGKCAWLCGGADEAATKKIQIDIRGQATKWLLSQ